MIKKKKYSISRSPPPSPPAGWAALPRILCLCLALIFSIIDSIDCVATTVTPTVTPTDLLNCDNCQLTAPTTPSDVSVFRDLLDEDEDPENEYKLWSAIAESLKEWAARKAASNQTKDIEILEQKEPYDPSNPHQKRSRKRRDEESICYGRKEFCFKDKGPFDYLDTLPASPESIGTTFKLYTNKNRPDPLKETGQFLDYDNATRLLISNFNASNDVKIIIHGFGSSSRRPWVLNITKALLDLDDFNVINVDWENGAKMPNYVQAAANTQLVGKQIAELIRLINYLTKLTPTRYHLIGFSLGAHVAGFTGMEFRNPNISRITGLDPAAPLFEGYDVGVRLDETDANFVDVIHSNGDGFIRGGLGSYTPMGTVDFYPNGGRVQVGCNSVLMGAITDIISGKWNSLCNHRRAFRFFLDSFKRTCTFHAFQCNSYEDYIKGDCFKCGQDGTGCSNMGYFAHLSKARGKMYLITREGEKEEPFCGNQFRVRLDSSRDGQSVTWGKVEIQLVNSNGLNETFTLSQESDEIKEGEKIQALIVAHSELTNVTEAILTYTKYKGWIYNGKNEWNIDRIEILDSTGKIKSYCHPRTKLYTTYTLRVPLTYGNCTLTLPLLETNSLSSVPVTSHMVPAPHPPHIFTGRPQYHPGPHYPPPPPQPVPVPIYPGPGYTLMKPEKPESAPSGSENDIDGSSSVNNPESAWNIIVRKYGNFFSYDDHLDPKRGNRTEIDQELLENQISGSHGPRGAAPGPGPNPQPSTNVPPAFTRDVNPNVGSPLNDPNSASSSESSIPAAEDRGTKPTPSNQDFNEDSGSNLLRSSEETDDNSFVPMITTDQAPPNSPRNRDTRQRKWPPPPPPSSPGNYGTLSQPPSVPPPGHIRTGTRILQPFGPSQGAIRSSVLPTPVANSGLQLGPPPKLIGPPPSQPQSEPEPPHGRWTRASSYLRNRTAALLNRLWHPSQTIPQNLNQQNPSPPPQFPPGPKPPQSINQLIDQDGMDILTDYSTLAYYILSHPGAAIVGETTSGSHGPNELPVDFRFSQPSPVAQRISPEVGGGGSGGPDGQNHQNSFARI